MRIEDKLIKDYWVRRVNPNYAPMHPSAVDSVNYRQTFFNGNGVRFQYLTQADFMSEIIPTCHDINDRFMSQRPIYAPTGKKDTNGKEEWTITGYDEVESVSLGLQACISDKKASHFAADGFWTALENTGNEEAFAKFQSWMDVVDIKSAYMQAIRSCFRTGDAAIYLYQTGKTIDYEVFSYEKGDVLFPSIDENRNPVLYRKYLLHGKQAVDIFTTKTRETWVKVDDSEKSKSWLANMANWFNTIRGEVSEDGYTLVSRSAAQTGDGLLQVVYFRIPDIPSGVAEQSIEQLEQALSYVSEEVKSSAFPILFLKSEKIINLPPNDMNAKTIGVKGSSETLQASDAKFIAPPDASDIATLNIEKLTENILHTTHTVFIDPDILKSGADSSTTIKILFTPEIQYCQTMWPYVSKSVRQVVEVMKTLVGKVEGNLTSEYADMKISCGQNIYIPQNDSERIKQELDQVYARVKSRKAAMQDIGNSHINDYKQIEKEWEDELDIKARIPAKAKAEIEKETGSTTTTEEVTVTEETNPNAPAIDNNSSGKSIAE